MKDYYIKADEISSILDRKICTGYKIIRELNAELQAKGYRTVQARVPREYFYERYGISERWGVIDGEGYRWFSRCCLVCNSDRAWVYQDGLDKMAEYLRGFKNE